MGDDLLTQIGLMLTQLRYARRTLEDIERSTARYAGFAFASALQAGPAFGAPPLEAGALKVHVVNIGDLTPGAGFGGFLESLLGGVGRFFGGLIGGFVGGTISGFNLPGVIASMLDLAKRIERILGILGISFAEDKDKGKKEVTATPTLKSQLDDIKEILGAFTALFTAATNPDKAGQMVTPKTKDGVEWLAILRTADALIRGISRVVDGLIILIPTLIGALASVIVHLREIQSEVLGLLQFLLKEIFLLRGVVLFTLWDTIAGAAHLGARVLSILGQALQTIITSIGGIFTKIFDAGLSILKYIAAGLKGTVDTLLRWLVDTVGAVLIALGDSKILRVVIHIVQVLPALLPPLLQLLDKPVEPADRKALEEAAKKTIEKPEFPPAGKKLSDMIPEFPDLTKTFAETASKETKIGDLGTVVKEAFDSVKADMKGAFDASINTLNQIGANLDEVKKDKSFLDALTEREATLRENSQKLADTLAKAQTELAKRPETGLETIAQKYEEWLTGGGMKRVLDQIEAHFKESPNTGEFGPPLPPTTVERPRATVEIKELLIELDPAADSFRRPVPEVLEASLEWPSEPYDPFEREHELRERCFTRAPGAPMLWS